MDLSSTASTPLGRGSAVSLTRASTVSSANGRGRRVKQSGGERTLTDDADARYAAALHLVQAIDGDLQKGTRHFHNSAGKLLLSLDEVVQAILNDDLVTDRAARFLPPTAAPKPSQRSPGTARDENVAPWSVVGEMVV